MDTPICTRRIDGRYRGNRWPVGLFSELLKEADSRDWTKVKPRNPNLLLLYYSQA